MHPKGVAAATLATDRPANGARGLSGEIQLETPRDRNGEFEPKIVAKRQTSMRSFTDMVVSLYTRGMTTRASEVQTVLA
jgi:transposase-like protein